MSDQPPGEQQVPTLDYASRRREDGPSWLELWLKRHFSEPPRLWQVILLGLIGADLAYSRSFPFGYPRLPFINYELGLVGMCLLIPCFFIVTADYFVRVLGCLCVHRLSFRDVRPYLVVMLIIATIVVLKSDRLVRWRFSKNRPALDAAVAALFRSADPSQRIVPGEAQPPDWKFATYDKAVGDYHVWAVGAFLNERIVYLQTGGFFRSGWGFLFDPDQRTDVSMVHLNPLGNGWYVYYYEKP